MIMSLKDAVYQKPSFEKIAEYELPTDISEWNEEILKQFYTDVDYLPKEMGVDIVVNNTDEKKGYAKGSVVVFYGEKKINFPIIVKDFKLSPFDVFVHKDGEKTNYYPGNLDNVKKILTSEKIGKLENYYGKGGPLFGVKSPGGVYPKVSVPIDETQSTYPPFSKMSSWPFLTKTEDLEKLAIQMEADPDVGQSFVDNTGDLVSNIIELKNKTGDESKVVGDSHKDGILDLKNVISAKQAVTAIDSELIDVGKLIPIKPPAVCELRMYQYPSMEDFMESGNSMASRFLATKVGKPIVGVVLDRKEEGDLDNCPTACCDSSDPKQVRNKRDQIFISACGGYYSIFNDYEKHGVGFYGTNIMNTKGAVGKTIELLCSKTTDDFINQNKENRRDGSDKLFKAIGEMEQGKNEHSYGYESSYWSTKMLVLFGAGDVWECVQFRGNYRKKRVNDTNVYTSKDTAIIPANVASIQKVASVEDPVYKMVVGKAKSIYLIPESSKIINCEYMKSLSREDFMRPDKSVQKTYQDAAIKKVAVYVASDSPERLGYRIDGKPMNDLKKIAKLDGKILTTSETVSALRIMGMSKEASQETLKVAMNRYADQECSNKQVVVYGVNDDYINQNVFADREKIARVKKLYTEYAYSLRRDLVKEASVLDAPDAVDVVLSLNFINEDSMAGYIENIEEMKRINSELAKMIIASRMGLSDLDESALKKSIEGLSEVIKGLENLKMATSPV